MQTFSALEDVALDHMMKFLRMADVESSNNYELGLEGKKVGQWEAYTFNQEDKKRKNKIKIFEKS